MNQITSTQKKHWKQHSNATREIFLKNLKFVLKLNTNFSYNKLRLQTYSFRSLRYTSD